MGKSSPPLRRLASDACRRASGDSQKKVLRGFAGRDSRGLTGGSGRRRKAPPVTPRRPTSRRSPPFPQMTHARRKGRASMGVRGLREAIKGSRAFDERPPASLAGHVGALQGGAFLRRPLPGTAPRTPGRKAHSTPACAGIRAMATRKGGKEARPLSEPSCQREERESSARRKRGFPHRLTQSGPER